MAGQVRGGIFAVLALVATAVSVLAQATPEPQSPPQTPLREGKHAWLADHADGAGPKGPAFENVRKALEALTPEQRQRFQENFIRWANLPPEEKKALRDREEVRRQYMEQEVQAAIQESGLQLDGDRRELFVKRYSEERRLIEEQLRKEMNEKRKPLVRALIARLRSEFSAEGTPSSSTTVPPSPGSQTIQTVSPAPSVKP